MISNGKIVGHILPNPIMDPNFLGKNNPHLLPPEHKKILPLPESFAQISSSPILGVLLIKKTF